MDTNEPPSEEKDSLPFIQCNGDLDQSPSKSEASNGIKKLDDGFVTAYEKESTVGGTNSPNSSESETKQELFGIATKKDEMGIPESIANSVDQRTTGNDHKEINKMDSLNNINHTNSKMNLSSKAFAESTFSQKSDFHVTESNTIEEKTKSTDSVGDNNKISCKTNSEVAANELLKSPDKDKSASVNNVSFSDMNKENKLTNSAETKIVNSANSKESHAVPQKPKKKQKARKSCQSSGSGSLIPEEPTDSGCNRPSSPSSVSALTKKTIKVTELESVLGIKNKALDTMDAKTLDMLVLQKAQQHIVRGETKPSLKNNNDMKNSQKGETNRIIAEQALNVDNIQAPIAPSNVSAVLAGQHLLGRTKKRKTQRFKGGRYALPGRRKQPKKTMGRRLSSTHSQADSCGTDTGSIDDTGSQEEMPELANHLPTPPETADTDTSLIESESKPNERRLSHERKSNKLKNQPKIDSMFKKQTPLPITKVDNEITFMHKSRKSLELMDSTTPKAKEDTNKHKIKTKSTERVRAWRQKRKVNEEDTSSVASSQTSCDDVTTGDNDVGSKNDSVKLPRGTTSAFLPAAPKRRRLEVKKEIKSDIAEGVSTETQNIPLHEQVMSIRGELDTDSDTDLFTHFKHTHSTPIKPNTQPVKFMNTPNGLTYPVTPPKTPESSNSSQIGGVSMEDRSLAQGQRVKDGTAVPLCCCKLPGTAFANVKHSYCHALDSVDGKTMACFNKVTNSHMVRASVRVPFMALCEVHRHRFKQHQCCPGCGQFCTQGVFIQCKKDAASAVIHYFHKNCQVKRDDKCYCPHCGEQSLQLETRIELSTSRQLGLDLGGTNAEHKKPQAPNARIGVGETKRDRDDQSEADSVSVTSSDSKVKISTKGMASGPSKKDLQSLIQVFKKDDTEKPGFKFRKGHRTLYHACRAGDSERALFLLLEGCDPNLKNADHDQQTALHIAAEKGYLGIVHLLLQAGAQAHVIDEDLRTPLMNAAEHKHSAIARVLSQSGAVVDFRASDGMTALHLAAKAGDLSTVRMIVTTFKINVNIIDDGGWTPLIWAAEFKHLDVIKYLMEVGSDPNVNDDEGNTGLHWACFSGSTDIAVVFLNAGCDIEASNEHGDRPLHIAARQGHLEVVTMLLARNADSLAKNNKNATPSDCVVDESSQLYMTLQVNKQLKTVAAKIKRPQKLLHRDVSMGKEQYPIPIVNEFDDENYPTDYQYVTDYVESTPMNINRVITSLQACECKDNCSTLFCNCGRNSVRCWYTSEGKLIEEFNYSDPPFVFECNRQCRCWANCQNRVIQLGISVRLQVFRCPGKGWGVHSLLDIPKGTYVCEYIGEILSDSEADKREDDSYLFDLDNRDSDSFCIDARRYGNVSRFINHACDPNLIPVKVFVDHQDLRFPRICFFARRPIKAYEELGFDYCEKFWIIKYKQFTCECGAANCHYSSRTIHKTVADYHKRQEAENDSS